MNADSYTFETLKLGYELKNDHYNCIFCASTFHVDEVFPSEGRLFNARFAVHQHLQHMHTSAFHALLTLDKKYTGLSDIQTEMLSYFHKGLDDKEIVHLSNANSLSTIRQHRFKLREKEKQAKVFLAIMDLLEQEDPYINIHKGAKQVDERYAITEKEKEKVLQTYFKHGLDAGIETIPSKEKKKIIILQHLMQRFEVNKQYSEKEVNDLLKQVNIDHVSLRRYLIEYGFMERSDDCSTYWVKKN